MRSLISLSVAVLLATLALAGDVAGQQQQSRKSKAKARVSHRASKTTSKAQTPSAPAQATVPVPAPVSTIAPQGDGVRRITPTEARAAIAQGKAIIVDVRGEDSYNAGHVQGARLIPVDVIGSRAGELPRDKLIITYCS